MKTQVTLAAILAAIIAGAAFGADSDIRLNSLGFLPAAAKKASIVATCSEFAVKKVSDGAGGMIYERKKKNG